MSDFAPTDCLVLHPNDDVGIALKDLAPGTCPVTERVQSGHKLALRDIQSGTPVLKFGSVIGLATETIAKGTHVHTHNLAFQKTDLSQNVRPHATDQMAKMTAATDTFMGYARSDGTVGTRNYIAVLTSVNCSATVATLVARNFPKEELDAYPNIDGIAPFVHGTGCGLDSDGEGFANLQRVLWGYARNPNVGGVLMIGLGCEVAQISFFLEAYGIKKGPLFRTLNIQSAGGTQRSIAMGMEALRDMLPAVNAVGRTPQLVSHIRLALQCGGSDAWSGVTSNPSLGIAADMLVNRGGTAVLAETPEIYGAEHLLLARATDESVAEKLRERLSWWERYTDMNGGSLDNNPSPGNKRGGLTTILEKSLGAVAKSGQSPLVDVLKYGEPIRKPGFQFMDSPGFDPVSVTGQIASGCTMVCFTTGRGSAFGSKPSPTIKLGSNSRLYERMPEDIDIDCGSLLNGDIGLDELGATIFREIIEVASGRASKSEAQGMGDLEFVPWQVGTTM